MKPHATPERHWWQKSRIWFGAYAAWFALLFLLSSLPGSGRKFRPFSGFDKLEHLGYFLGGSMLLGFALLTRGDWPRRWWWLLVAAAAVGAFDEWHQQFSPGRSALSVGDWFADVLGGLGAVLVMAVFRRRWSLLTRIPTA